MIKNEFSILLKNLIKKVKSQILILIPQSLILTLIEENLTKSPELISEVLSRTLRNNKKQDEIISLLGEDKIFTRKAVKSWIKFINNEIWAGKLYAEQITEKPELIPTILNRALRSGKNPILRKEIISIFVNHFLNEEKLNGLEYHKNVWFTLQSKQSEGMKAKLNQELLSYFLAQEKAKTYTESHVADHDFVNIQGELYRHLGIKDAIKIHNEISLSKFYDIDLEKSDPIIYDLGANYGHFTIHQLKRYPNAEITCFEPNPLAFKVLKSNLKQFKSAKINIENKAVSNSYSTSTLHIPLEMPMGASIFPRSSLDEIKKKSVTVSTVPLLDYLTTSRVDLLKIDAEGAEDIIIENISSRLRNIDNIIMEFHFLGHGKDIQRLLNIYSLLLKNEFVVSGSLPQNPYSDTNFFKHLRCRKSFLIIASK